MDEKFKEYVECAIQYKDLTKKYTNELCKILTSESPSSNTWYYHDGFFRVDIVPKQYDDYMEFIENIMDCSYCHLMTPTGLTLMLSLTTLHGKL